MGDEENPDENAYTITKYLEDGQTITEHNSRNYTGKASVVYATKDKYEGDFKDGLRDGVGTYTYFKEEGPQNKYEGEWQANKKHGIGKMIYGNVGEYFGRFENGKRHGEGVFRYNKSGNVYSGSWKYGVKNGHGEFIFNDTKMKIAGEWENGKMIKGQWIFPNGTYFEGPFVNNYPKGEGVWHFINGNTVKGEFSQELKDNENPEPEVEGEEPDAQITVVSWKTNPEIVDPTRELYKEEPTLELPPEEEQGPVVTSMGNDNNENKEGEEQQGEEGPVVTSMGNDNNENKEGEEQHGEEGPAVTSMGNDNNENKEGEENKDGDNLPIEEGQ